MDSNKLDTYLTTNQKMFPEDKILSLKEKLAQVDDATFDRVSATGLKDPMMMFLISVFVGELGVDRFMMKEIGMGIVKLVSFGGFGILYLIDVIKIMKKVKEMNYNNIIAAL